MRSTPVVALAALLACLPARAVDVIDMGASAHWPAYVSIGVPVDLPLGLSPGLPIGPPAEPSSPAPAYVPAYAPAYAPAYFPAPFAAYYPARSPAYFPTRFFAYPMPSPNPPGPVSGDERTGIPSSAALADLALPAESLAQAGTVAEATPVPEPVSVLMLACGLLLMVPGAWATRWSRLGDTESLLQRRFP